MVLNDGRDTATPMMEMRMQLPAVVNKTHKVTDNNGGGTNEQPAPSNINPPEPKDVQHRAAPQSVPNHHISQTGNIYPTHQPVPMAYQSATGYNPMMGYQPARGHNPMMGFHTAAGYNPMIGYHPAMGYRPAMGYYPHPTMTYSSPLDLHLPFVNNPQTGSFSPFITRQPMGNGQSPNIGQSRGNGQPMVNLHVLVEPLPMQANPSPTPQAHPHSLVHNVDGPRASASATQPVSAEQVRPQISKSDDGLEETRRALTQAIQDWSTDESQSQCATPNSEVSGVQLAGSARDITVSSPVLPKSNHSGDSFQDSDYASTLEPRESCSNAGGIRRPPSCPSPSRQLRHDFFDPDTPTPSHRGSITRLASGFRHGSDSTSPLHLRTVSNHTELEHGADTQNHRRRTVKTCKRTTRTREVRSRDKNGNEVIETETTTEERWTTTDGADE